MSSTNRPRLDQILGGDGGDFNNLWDATEPADEWGPLPAGTYRAVIVNGELSTSKVKLTPSYKLTLEVLTPVAHAGRKLWHDLWLTPKALSKTKRDLAKLRIHRREQLEQSPPIGMIVEIKVALRTQDDGAEFNKVLSFKVVSEGTPLGVLDSDPDEDDAEGDSRDASGFDWSDGQQKEKPQP